MFTRDARSAAAAAVIVVVTSSSSHFQSFIPVCRLHVIYSQVTVCYFTKYWMYKAFKQLQMVFSADHMQFSVSLLL